MVRTMASFAKVQYFPASGFGKGARMGPYCLEKTLRLIVRDLQLSDIWLGVVSRFWAKLPQVESHEPNHDAETKAARLRVNCDTAGIAPRSKYRLKRGSS